MTLFYNVLNEKCEAYEDNTRYVDKASTSENNEKYYMRNLLIAAMVDS